MRFKLRPQWDITEYAMSMLYVNSISSHSEKAKHKYFVFHSIESRWIMDIAALAVTRSSSDGGVSSKQKYNVEGIVVKGR